MILDADSKLSYIVTMCFANQEVWRVRLDILADTTNILRHLFIDWF